MCVCVCVKSVTNSLDIVLNFTVKICMLLFSTIGIKSYLERLSHVSAVSYFGLHNSNSAKISRLCGKQWLLLKDRPKNRKEKKRKIDQNKPEDYSQESCRSVVGFYRLYLIRVNR